MPIILRFLQSLLEKKLSASTLRVYVAVISARHIKVDNQSTVTCFLKGAQLQNPPTGITIPAWDLPLVLEAPHLLRG